MSNKEIKFDVLENADLSQIEQIGIDDNMLDEETKNRMFRYALNKYNKMSGKNINEKGVDSMEYVCGVEKVDKRKSPKIVMTICGIAATFALVVGSMALLKGNKTNPPVTPKPLDIANTTTVTTNVTVGTTATTETAAPTETSTETVTQTKTFDPQAIEAAKTKAVEDFAGMTNEAYYDIEYAQVDLNDDSVPELIISGDCLAGDRISFLYFFNGTDYVDSGNTLNEVMYCADKHYLSMGSKYMKYAIYEVTADNKLKLIDEPEIKNPDDYLDATNDFIQKYELNNLGQNNYNWQELDYTFYADHNAAVIDNPPVLTADIDMAGLVSQGIIPADERSYAVNFQYIDENMEECGGCVADQDYEISSLEKSVISRTTQYNYSAEARYGVELYDRVNDIRYSKLCVADVNYITGEIKVLSDMTNGAASFRFGPPDETMEY